MSLVPFILRDREKESARGDFKNSKEEGKRNYSQNFGLRQQVPFHRFERSYRETNTTMVQRKSNDLRKFYVERERERKRKENQIFPNSYTTKSSESRSEFAQPSLPLLLLSSFRTFADTSKSARPRSGGRLNGEFSGSSTMQIRGVRRKHGFLRKDITVGNATFVRF